MGKTLIIAEKPNLAQVIASALKVYNKSNGFVENDKYIISFAIGHLFELQDVEKYLGVEKLHWKETKLPFIPSEFKFTLKDKYKEQYEILKKLINRLDVDMVVNCGDAEREGQLIIDLIIQNIGTNKPIKRLWLPEQTEDTIQKQINNLDDNSKYKNLFNEGLARTYMDWLLGINITRYLTLQSGTLLRAGRVLIPIVKVIYDREMAIRNFISKTYFLVESPLKKDEIELLLSVKNKKFEENQEEDAKKFAENLNKYKAIVTESEKKETKKFPGKLFSLDKLQGFLSKKYKIDFTNSLAAIQSLYLKGYLTYPRTNTEYLSENEKDKVKEILNKVSSDHEVVFKDSKKLFDDSKIESHSAIIITTKIPKEEDITDKIEKLAYQTVFNRFISNFLKEDTLIDQVIVNIKVGEEVFEFKGETVKKEGYLKYEPEKIENNLPEFKVGEEFEVYFKPSKKKTTPPQKMTEEELGNYLKNPFRTEKMSEEEEYRMILEGVEIGTNATRTGIIDNAIGMNYISRKNSSFSLETLGEKLIEILNKLNVNLFKEKTIEFSKILKKIYKEEATLEDILALVSKELNEIVNSNIEIKKIDKNNLKEEFGKCLVCGKPVYKGKTKKGTMNYYCSGYKEGCSFFLWEEMSFGKLNTVKITDSRAKSLLSKKTIKVKLKNSTNKVYEANLKIKINGKYTNLELDSFVNKKTPT